MPAVGAAIEGEPGGVVRQYSDSGGNGQRGNFVGCSVGRCPYGGVICKYQRLEIVDIPGIPRVTVILPGAVRCGLCTGLQRRKHQKEKKRKRCSG